MQETIPVIRENAIKAYNGASKEGKQLLSDLLGKQHFYRDPTEWVTSKELLCEAAGVSAWPSDVSDREKLFMSVFNKQPDGTLWKANWADHTQKKWRIIARTVVDASRPLGFRLAFHRSVYDYDYTFLGCRLNFKDEKTTNHIGKYFMDDLEDSIIY